jgi:hypothetical protein
MPGSVSVPSSASSARRTRHGGIPKRSAKGLQPTTVRLSELAPSARVTEPHRVVGFEVVLGALLAAGGRGVVSGIHLLGEERHGLLGEVAAVAGDPFVVGVDEDRADESDDSRGVGEGPGDSAAALLVRRARASRPTPWSRSPPGPTPPPLCSALADRCRRPSSGFGARSWRRPRPGPRRCRAPNDLAP